LGASRRQVGRRAAQDLVLLLKPALSRRNWTNSFCSLVVLPSTTPSSISAWRTQCRTVSTEMSKSAATSACV
jgi:hypothetical protein